MKEFTIRAYGRMELASLYSPELTDIAAYRKMKKWILLCPGLLQRLYDLGYQQLPFFHTFGGKSDYRRIGRTIRHGIRLLKL